MIRSPPRSPLFPFPTLFDSPADVPWLADDRAGTVDDLDEPELPEGLELPAAGEEAAHKAWQDYLEHRDRKSTRLNSSHANISYAVFCLKKNRNSNFPTDPSR